MCAGKKNKEHVTNALICANYILGADHTTRCGVSTETRESQTDNGGITSYENRTNS